MSTIDIPKSRRQQIDELSIGESFQIDNEKRQTYANVISAFHRDTHRQFVIRMNRDTKEVRVYRLEDQLA